MTAFTRHPVRDDPRQEQWNSIIEQLDRLYVPGSALTAQIRHLRKKAELFYLWNRDESENG